MEPREELSQELRRARTWILVVGILIFTVDQLLLRVVQGDKLPEVWQTRFLILDSVVLAYFIGLYVLASRQPKLACILALIGFWGLHVGLAIWIGDFSTLFTNGIIMKALFTMALVRGLRSATRAEYLKKDLEKVFG